MNNALKLQKLREKREINRENVFEDKEDKRKFTEFQSDCKAVSG